MVRADQAAHFIFEYANREKRAGHFPRFQYGTTYPGYLWYMYVRRDRAILCPNRAGLQYFLACANYCFYDGGQPAIIP